MKTTFIAMNSAVIGIITAIYGFGWFNSDWSVNPAGAGINIFAVLTVVIVANVIWPCD